MKISLYNNQKNWFYKIKPADENLDFEKLVLKFNVSEEEIKFLNPNFQIKSGNILILPASSKYFHIAQPLETYFSVSKMYNCSVEQLKQQNKTLTIFVGQKIFI